MPLALFILGKFLAYWAYCALTPRALGFAEPLFLRFGFLHAVLRLAFGFVGFFLIVLVLESLRGDAVPGILSYALAFVPVRVVEWFVLFLVIARSRALPLNLRAAYWVLGGVMVSCLCDAVAIVLLDAGVVHLNIC